MMKWTTLVTDCEELLYGEKFDWSGRRQISLSDAFRELLHHKLSCGEILILTDKQETLNVAERLQVPVVGLELGHRASFNGTKYILQEIGTESAAFLERVYKRYYEQPVVIWETKHLCLREMVKSDTEHLYRLYQVPDVRKEVSQADLSREELAEFVESYRTLRYPLYDYGMWIIEEKETGKFVGEAGVEEDSHDRIKQSETGVWLEAGYAICPEFRSKGYAEEGLEAIVKFVRMEKESYGFERISCYIRPENIASVRTAERCGFIRSRDERCYGGRQELAAYRMRL